MDPLDLLLAYVRERYDPVGIVVGGSIIRGEGSPGSDYDVFIIHTHPWRVRDQQRFGGVAAELFVNPPSAVRRYFQSEHREGRPVTAHLLATGRIIDPEQADVVVHELVTEARQWLSLTPDLPDLVPMRYFAIDLLDDARDVHGLDDAAELLLLGQVVQQIVDYSFRSRSMFLPRRKTRVAALAAFDPAAADLVRRFASAPVHERLAIVEALALHVLSVDRFFCWTSPREPVSRT